MDYANSCVCIRVKDEIVFKMGCVIQKMKAQSRCFKVSVVTRENTLSPMGDVWSKD